MSIETGSSLEGITCVTPMEIFDGIQSHYIRLKTSEPDIAGQTKGLRISLGTYNPPPRNPEFHRNLDERPGREGDRGCGTLGSSPELIYFYWNGSALALGGIKTELKELQHTITGRKDCLETYYMHGTV